MYSFSTYLLFRDLVTHFLSLCYYNILLSNNKYSNRIRDSDAKVTDTDVQNPLFLLFQNRIFLHLFSFNKKSKNPYCFGFWKFERIVSIIICSNAMKCDFAFCNEIDIKSGPWGLRWPFNYGISICKTWIIAADFTT